MNHLIAITIGPIFDTLQQARKTRELWAASYLFSHCMKLIMNALTEMGATILLPQKIEDESKPRYGAGVYNDRLFASISESSIPKVDSAIEAALKKFAADVAVKSDAGAPGFWQQYLRIQWAHKPIDSLKDGALFKQFEPLLDAAELHRPYFLDAPQADLLIELLDDVYKTEMAQSALKDKGVYDGMMKGLFPSTTDLSTFELFQKDRREYNNILNAVNPKEELDQEQMDQFYEKIFKKGSPFDGTATDYHKYFCIVHADGDNLGNLNRALNKEQDYQGLSRKLSGFALEAAKTINDYGGKPVYIGGDDLLFFAPVCCRKEGKTVSVFQLIAALNKQYDALELQGTTLSFGITISYHKFPLFEARQLSYEQLAYHAKKVLWTKNGEKKNAVAFRLLKHSGAYFEGLLSKPVLKAFVETEEKLRKIEGDLISGVVFKMETLSGLFGLLEAEQVLEGRIGPLFDNFFNEPIHRDSKEQMKQVQSLLLAVYQSAYQIKEQKADHTRNLYAILRLLKFVTDKPQRKLHQPAPTEGAETSIHS